MFLDYKEIKFKQRRFNIEKFMLDMYWAYYVEWELARYNNVITEDYRKASTNVWNDFEGFIDWAMANSVLEDYTKG